MKLTILLIAICSITLFSCLDDECTGVKIYTKMVPVYVTEDGLRPDVVVQTPRELRNPGKIYAYNGLLFINELREGVHVIDNRHPDDPVSIAFIEIPGNLDIAIKDNILYADLYRDLVSIDISDVLNAKLINRTINVFESYIPFDESEEKYVVAYESTEETLVLNCSDNRWGRSWFNASNGAFFDFKKHSS